jgi:5-methylcytosine-specific restriction endonuclease McrA
MYYGAMAIWLVRKRCRRNTNRVLELLDRDGNLCWICGTPLNLHYEDDRFPHITVDHVVPKCRGGTLARSNIRLAHRFCNNRRQDRPCPAHPWWRFDSIVVR